MRSRLKAVMSAMHRPIYEHRLGMLVDSIIPQLRAGEVVLDVGCGAGTLGRALLDDPRCPAGVRVRGLERAPRGGEPIEVIGYGGGRIPLDDGSVDVAIVADVLHHEHDPASLAAECARVSRRLLIIKDHQIKGPLAQARVGFMDWAANAPYGVPCLYRYNTPREWTDFCARMGMSVVIERSGMRLYPAVVEQVFGGALQYMVVLTHEHARGAG